MGTIIICLPKHLNGNHMNEQFYISAQIREWAILSKGIGEYMPEWRVQGVI